MATYVLIHGGGDSAWCWHRLAADLRERAHDVVAVDLPCEDESAGLWDNATAVVDAIGGRRDLVVVGHSLGGFTAPLVCTRVPVDLLVLVAGMVPAPGETANEWLANAGDESATHDDEMTLFYHDVPPELAAEAVTKWRHQAETPLLEAWPLDAWPDVPTRYLLCRDDRVFPADWTRRMVRERLGIAPDEIDGGHFAFLSRPREVAERLEAYRAELRDMDFYDAELRAHNERLRAATGVGRGDRVLDIGCGTGQSTRDAARAAAPGRVLGIDVSARMLERARQLTAAERLDNVTYEHGDAQVHGFAPEHFDLAISRFGAMFFPDPVAAFGNVARALRPDGRLVLLVWQGRERNEWAMAIDGALCGPTRPPEPPSTLDPFSFGDPTATERILERAGFEDIQFEDVHEPVFFGRDSTAALEWVRGFQCTSAALAALSRADADRALGRLRDTLAAHHSGQDGVVFDSRAWIITARRR
jgi:SAM-dependent methyltransferase